MKMKNKIKIFILTLTCLAIIPSLVFAFGEVAGPVVIHVPIGGSNTSTWGIFNGEAITTKLSAEGDAAKYISLPEKVSLEGNNKVYLVDVAARIPADYNLTQGTNITGTLYALAEGNPGQVQINLQVKKNVFILVEQPQVSNLESGQFGNLITGMFALKPGNIMSVIGLFMIIVVTFIYFTKNRREVNK